MATTDRTDEQVRELLAEVTGLPATITADLPAEVPLLTGELGLTSLAGARLLVLVRDRFGVDVAAEDLALRSLESLGTLSEFVRARRR